MHLTIRNNVSSVQQFRMRKIADRAVVVVGGQHGGTEMRLVNADLDLPPQIPLERRLQNRLMHEFRRIVLRLHRRKDDLVSFILASYNVDRGHHLKPCWTHAHADEPDQREAALVCPEEPLVRWETGIRALPLVAHEAVVADFILVGTGMTLWAIHRVKGKRGIKPCRLADSVLRRDQRERLPVPPEVTDVLPGERYLAIERTHLQPLNGSVTQPYRFTHGGPCSRAPQTRTPSMSHRTKHGPASGLAAPGHAAEDGVGLEQAVPGRQPDDGAGPGRFRVMVRTETPSSAELRFMPMVDTGRGAPGSRAWL